MPETASRAARLRNEKASGFHQTLKQEKGVPIPRHALLSANRHDGERMASPVPFALRFTPRHRTSPWLVWTSRCDIRGRNGLALRCLNPAVVRKLCGGLEKFDAPCRSRPAHSQVETLFKQDYKLRSMGPPGSRISGTQEIAAWLQRSAGRHTMLKGRLRSQWKSSD